MVGNRRKSKRSKGSTAKPEKRVLLGVRIPERLIKALRSVAVVRANAGREPSSRQGIIEAALEDWLRRHGHSIAGVRR